MNLTIDELKGKVSEAGIEAHLTELGLGHRLEQYKADQLTALDSDYVFPQDKLLPVHTQLTAAVAKKSVELLADGDDKETVLATIANAIDSLFPTVEGSTVTYETFLEAQKEVPAASAVDPIVSATVLDEPEAIVTAQAIPAAVEPEQVAALQVTDADQFMTTILDSLDDRLTSRFKDLEDRILSVVTAKYEAEVKGLAQEQIKALRIDIENKKLVETQLTEKTKQAIIGQIVLVEDIQPDSEYLTILNGRTVEQLQHTLQDILYRSRESKPVVAAISDSQSTISEPEPVSQDVAITAMSEEAVVESTINVLDNLNIQDSLSLIIQDHAEKELTEAAYKQAYVSVYKSHGSLGARRFHNEMKALNKIPKSK